MRAKDNYIELRLGKDVLEFMRVHLFVFFVSFFSFGSLLRRTIVKQIGVTELRGGGRCNRRKQK